MVYFGRIQGGKIIPDEGTELPEGVRVRIEPVDPLPTPCPDDPVYRLYELAGEDTLPEDLAREHDHYLYGTPKRNR